MQDISKQKEGFWTECLKFGIEGEPMLKIYWEPVWDAESNMAFLFKPLEKPEGRQIPNIRNAQLWELKASIQDGRHKIITNE